MAVQLAACVIAIYFDRLFTACHPSPQKFTGFGLQNPTDHVTDFQKFIWRNQHANTRAVLLSSAERRSSVLTRWFYASSRRVPALKISKFVFLPFGGPGKQGLHPPDVTVTEPNSFISQASVTRHVNKWSKYYSSTIKLPDDPEVLVGNIYWVGILIPAAKSVWPWLVMLRELSALVMVVISSLMQVQTHGCTSWVLVLEPTSDKPRNEITVVGRSLSEIWMKYGSYNNLVDSVVPDILAWSFLGGKWVYAFCNTHTNKRLNDWWQNKLGYLWLLPSLNHYLSKMSNTHWDLIPDDTNAIEGCRLNNTKHSWRQHFCEH
ncbi:hypothetical protein GGX14DRAFT_408991 [Mycena pura]|uniref:Uncharacterized protein n=1 Tax=Mycena pura TaxID=153505 RepID=A0AAD6Y0R6_9AGAR|nr:hypothetical protein GGX14DRAFT_408991 [Mycena pura]